MNFINPTFRALVCKNNDWQSQYEQWEVTDVLLSHPSRLLYKEKGGEREIKTTTQRETEIDFDPRLTPPAPGPQ